MRIARTVSSKTLVVALSCATMLAASSARSTPRAGGFSAEELAIVRSFLDRHALVGVTESAPDGSPLAMTLAVRIAAPRDQAIKIFENPENFYYLSTLFKENKVHEEHGNTKAYSWASRHKLFSFTGTNTITLFPPRRVDVNVVNSTLGSGTFRFDFHEDEGNRTILVLSGILGVKTSDLLIRFLLGGNPAMQQAMNTAIGIVVVKGAKNMAERMAAGKPPARHRVSGPTGGALRPLGPGELRDLMPLVDRGVVTLVDDNRGGRLRQATVIESVSANTTRVLDAVSAPERYPQMMRAVSDVTVHDKSDAATDFSWTLGLSAFSITSRNRMVFERDGVAVDATEGDLAGARWRWQLATAGESRTVVAYHGWAPIAKAASILDRSLKREPYLEQGLMVGTNMVMLRAIRRSVEGQRI